MPSAPTRNGPPCWQRLPEGYEAWLVTRYDDARGALSDRRLTRDHIRAMLARAEAGLPAWHGGGDRRGTALLECDPPKHTELRDAVNAEFTRRRIARLRPMIRRTADDLVAGFAADGAADLAELFALPLTVATLCEFVGIPFQDRDRFHRWVHDVHVVDLSPRGARRIAEAVAAMDGYFDALINDKREHRARIRRDVAPDDVLERLIAADSGALGHDDLVAMGRSLLVGGYESTKSLIVTGLLHLLRHDDQLRALRADHTLIPGAVEEFLRYDPPFPRLQERYALEDIELGEVAIRQGEPVVIDLAAANRDPSRFRHPSELDTRGADRGHLAFGPGIHHCLGAALARAETGIAIEVVLTRLPGIALDRDPDTLHWPPGILSAPSTLPVRFRPSTGARVTGDDLT